MGLKIHVREGESYFLIATQPVDVGSYIRIEIDTIYDNDNKKSSREFIDAPEEIRILREKHIKKDGGIEQTIKKIRENYLKGKIKC